MRRCWPAANTARSIVPGKSDQSRLILVLTGKAKPAMPPEDNEKPTAAEIAHARSLDQRRRQGPRRGRARPDRARHAQDQTRGPTSREAVTAVAYAPDGKSAGRGPVQHGRNACRCPSGRWCARIRSASGTDQRGELFQGWRPVAGRRAASRACSAKRGCGTWPTASCCARFRVIRTACYAAVLSPDGKLLATSSYDQQIKLWDVGQRHRSCARSPVTTTPCSIWRFGPTARCWPAPAAIARSSCGTWPAASGSTRSASRSRNCTPWPSAPTASAWRPAASTIAFASGRSAPTAKENTNPLLYSRFAHEGAVVKLVYSADGKTLVSAGEDRTVKIWDAETLTERFELERQSDWASALAISPDGKAVAVGRLDGSLAFYDAATGAAHSRPAAAQARAGVAVDPRRVRSARPARIKLTGKHLADVTAVKTSHEKLAATIVAVESPTQVEIEVTRRRPICRAAAMRSGSTSPAGESGKQPLARRRSAASRRSRAERRAGASQRRSTLPADMWGVLAAKGDVDSFALRSPRRAEAGVRGRGRHASARRPTSC